MNKIFYSIPSMRATRNEAERARSRELFSIVMCGNSSNTISRWKMNLLVLRREQKNVFFYHIINIRDKKTRLDYDAP